MSKDNVVLALEYLYQKKIIKKILEINDKTSPFYVRINSKIDNKSIKKLLDKYFKNMYILE